jgi:hypothetical protein
MPTTDHHQFIPPFKDASSEWVPRLNLLVVVDLDLVLSLQWVYIQGVPLLSGTRLGAEMGHAVAILDLFRIHLARLIIVAPDPAELESDADEDSSAVDEMEYNSVSSMCSEEDTTDTCSTCEFYVQFARYVRR